ncbi:MAG: hypothetical protein KC620_23380, partial [Myxococcales bacterium]|nr:hypothetical protein [Myxococcales bacterium]
LRQAEHAETRLGDPARAFALYRHGVEMGGEAARAFTAGLRRVGLAGVPGALEAMIDLFTRRGDHVELAGAFEDAAAIRAEDAERAELLYRAGEIYETQMGDPAAAMERYLRAFKLQPRTPRYLAAGERLYRALGDWPMVDRLLGLQVKVHADPEAKRALLVEQARVRREALADPLGAYDAARAALRREGTATVEDAAWSLLAELAVDDASFAVIAEGLCARADAEVDGLSASRHLLELAALHLDLREEVQAGLARLAEAADCAPDDEALFQRVAEQLEVHGGPAALAAWLTTAIDRPLPTEQRLRAARRAGLLYRDAVADPRAAHGAWTGVLELRPHDERAFGEALDSAKAAADAQATAALLDGALDGRFGPRQPKTAVRQGWLRGLAAARMNAGDTEGAIEAWRRLLAELPSDAEALAAVRDGLAERGEWMALSQVLAAAVVDHEAHERVFATALRLELADIIAGPLGDAATGVAWLEPLLDVPAARQRAMIALRGLYSATGDRRGAMQLARTELAEASPETRAAAAERLAALAEAEPIDLGALADALRVLVDQRPEDEALFERALTVHRLNDDRPALASLLGRRWHRAPSPARLDALRERARLLDELHRRDEAATAWTTLLEHAPDDPEGLTALQQIEARRGDDGAVFTLLWRRQNLATEATARIALLREAAVVAELRLGDMARAAEAWRTVRAFLPDDAEALDELMRLAEERGDQTE